MIKVEVTLTLTCDTPACEERDCIDGSNEHEARLAARAFGWWVPLSFEARSPSTSALRAKNERVYCPKCTRKRTEVRP